MFFGSLMVLIKLISPSSFYSRSPDHFVTEFIVRIFSAVGLRSGNTCNMLLITLLRSVE
jgi:hypothetical protein